MDFRASWRIMLVRRFELFRLQFHQAAPYTSYKSRDGRWRHRSSLERGRFGFPLGNIRAEEGGKASRMSYERPCNECHTTGRNARGEDCPNCNGTGWLDGTTTHDPNTLPTEKKPQ
jgi:hypothetical protein